MSNLDRLTFFKWNTMYIIYNFYTPFFSDLQMFVAFYLLEMYGSKVSNNIKFKTNLLGYDVIKLRPIDKLFQLLVIYNYYL